MDMFDGLAVRLCWLALLCGLAEWLCWLCWMNMFNLSAGRDCRKNAGSLSVILTGGATDKPCNCSSYIRTPSLKYTNSISQCQIEPAPHLHLTQSCLRLCRAHCLDFPIVSVCRDATEAPVGKVTVAKDRPIIYSGPRRPQKGPISWRNCLSLKKVDS